MDGNNLSEETTQAETVEVTEEVQGLEIDPVEVERQMIEAAHARSQDPTEMAATVFQMYMPYFDQAIPKLSTRGLRRVLKFLVKYPLEQDDINAASQFEKDVMNLANSLIEAKFVMIMDTYSKSATELYEASQKPLTEEEVKEIEKSLDNSTSNDVE